MARKVIHVFSSGIVDIADTTQVLASDWNAQHLVAEELTNRTGVTLAVGDVVALDSANNESVVLADTQGVVRALFCHLGKISGRGLVSSSNLDVGFYANQGDHLTLVNGAVTRLNYLRKSATTRVLEDMGISSLASPPPSGCVAIALASAVGPGAATIQAQWLGTVAYSGHSQVARGLHLRIHPNNNLAPNEVMLVRADEIVMDDGTRVADWDRLTAHALTSGAGGIDTGSEVASTWYEIYAIRKSSDGTKNLLLHRAKDYFLDTSFTTATDAARALRLLTSTATDKLAQGFKVATAGKVEFADFVMERTGGALGNFWLEIQSDSAGNPSGTILATSDKLDAGQGGDAASNNPIRMIFRNPATLSTATQYHLVLNGDYARSDTVHIKWRGLAAGGYADGAAKEFNGSTWAAASGVGDFFFKVYVTRNDTAVTMPTGYDQKAKIGWVRNDGSSNFVPFVARGRVVKSLASQNLGATAEPTAVLGDASAFIPPGVVSVHVGVRSTVTADQVGYAGVPAGYQLPESTVTVGANHAVNAVSLDYPGVPFVTEYQGIYYVRSAGTGNVDVFVRGWEW